MEILSSVFARMRFARIFLAGMRGVDAGVPHAAGLR
jgi:hypothetical protein